MIPWGHEGVLCQHYCAAARVGIHIVDADDAAHQAVDRDRQIPGASVIDIDTVRRTADGTGDPKRRVRSARVVQNVDRVGSKRTDGSCRRDADSPATVVSADDAAAVGAIHVDTRGRNRQVALSFIAAVDPKLAGRYLVS